MKSFCYVFIFFFVALSTTYSQVNPVDLYSKITIDTARVNFTQNAINNTIEATFALKSDSVDTKKFQEAFWAMELLNYKNDNIKQKLYNLFSKFDSFDLEFKRSLLEIVFTMYPAEFKDNIEKLLPTINNEKLFAMCVNYLIKNNYSKSTLLKKLEKQFSNWEENPILTYLHYELKTDVKDRFATTPPLKDLLHSGSLFNKMPVVFSIQRHNRDYQGIAIIRDKDGNLVKNKDGSIFYVKQLARAVTNLNGYITNGNTPQGIFSIQKIGKANSKFIGPTPTLELVLPYEVNSTLFLHSPYTTVPEWSLEFYKSMLPESWLNYTPILEAFYAGKAGRNEILSHGTTVDPVFYKDAPFFPNTPTYGCLCTYEIWDRKSGQCLESDQVNLVNAFLSTYFYAGYFVVVEIDDQNKDVTIEEVLNNF
ncbi:MAG: hypothetical protein V1773_01625 [bacterium]